ncbi:TolC family protein [Prochlorococcus marinus]|uniref:TolC family protein n=3 Tax=Prochlorococcus marinus TaxID=1219 RepID=UPI003A7FDFEC
MNYNYGLSKVSREIAINDQALSRKYIYPKEDIFNSKNHDYESKEVELATISLPSEIKEREIIKIKFDELLNLIIKNNSEYKAAFQRVEQSKNRLLATISQKSPTIDLNSNGLPEYLYIDHYTNPDITGTSYKRSEQFKASISATIRWDIINPKRNPQIQASKKTFEKAKNSFIIVSRDLELKAKIDFINLKKAQEKFYISKKAVKISSQSLKDVRLRNKALVATNLEVLEAENQLSRDQMFLNKSIRDVNKASKSLSNVLGLNNAKKIIADSEGVLIGEWKRTLEESIASALKFRLSLVNYDLDIQINNEKSKEELGDSLPKISLVNTFTISRDQGQTEVIPPIDRDDYEERTSNSIGLFGEWKVFDAGKSRQLSKFYKNKSIESKYQSQKERSLIIKEVENNYIDLETSIQNIFSTSRAIIKNNKMLQISIMRFKAGVTNQREIVNLQRDLKQSQINYLDAIKNYNISIAKLQRSTGLTKLEKCNTKNLEKDFNSFDEYSLYTLPIIPINKACEISLSINSLNEIKINSTNNEPIKVINEFEDKNDSPILDSYIPKNKILNNPNSKDNQENINNKILNDPKTKDNQENTNNKILNDSKTKDNQENTNNKILNDSKTKDNQENTNNKILNDPKTENQNKKTKNIKELNFKFKKIDKNNSSYLKNIQPCSTLIKDSDICLDNFVD